MTPTDPEETFVQRRIDRLQTKYFPELCRRSCKRKTIGYNQEEYVPYQSWGVGETS